MKKSTLTLLCPVYWCILAFSVVFVFSSPNEFAWTAWVYDLLTLPVFPPAQELLSQGISINDAYAEYEAGEWKFIVLITVIVMVNVGFPVSLWILDEKRVEQEKLARWEADPKLADVEQLMESPRKMAELLVELRSRDPWLNRIHEEAK